MKFLKTAASLVLVLSLAPTLASARPPTAVEKRLTPQFQQCMSTGDAAEGITAGMMDCLGDENKRQDAVLNANYRALMATLPTTAKDDLRLKERTWIKLRKAKCEAEAAREGGGSASGLIYSDCWMQETARRGMQLEAMRAGR